MRWHHPIGLFMATAAVVLLPSCAQDAEPDPDPVPEVPAEEITAQVQELDAIHEVMRPMWHDAWPAGDYEAIREAVAEFGPLVDALDAASLPGILQDKQARWDEQKALLLETYQGLQTAAEEGENEEMMAMAEAFHMNYEGMVRIIRPVVPELDVFHQSLYGLYHYYGPGYDLEKIQAAADEMAAAVSPLMEATLPARVADRQEEFDAAVIHLGDQVAHLLVALEDPVQEEVMEAIDSVHTAYQAVEALFD